MASQLMMKLNLKQNTIIIDKTTSSTYMYMYKLHSFQKNNFIYLADHLSYRDTHLVYPLPEQYISQMSEKYKVSLIWHHIIHVFTFDTPNKVPEFANATITSFFYDILIGMCICKYILELKF